MSLVRTIQLRCRWLQYRSVITMMLINSLIIAILSAALNISLVGMVSHLDLLNNNHIIFIFTVFMYSLGLSIFIFISEFNSRYLSYKIYQPFLHYVYNKILSAPLHVHASHTSGELSQRLANYERALLALVPTINSIIFSVIYLVVMWLCALYFHILLASLCILLTLSAVIFKYIITKKSIKYAKFSLTKNAEVSSFLGEIFSQIEKVRSANATEVLYHRWLNMISNIKSIAMNSMKLDVAGVALQLTIPIILYLCIYSILYTNPHAIAYSLLIPIFFFIGQYAGVLDKLFTDLASMMHLIHEYKLTSIILDEADEQSGIERIDNFSGDVVLKNLSYQHPVTRIPILLNSSLHIDANSFVGIIGSSGVGKSTFFKLILGLLPPDSGAILLDGHHLRQLDIQAIRSQFGVVLQTSTLMSGTILSNLAAHMELSLDDAWELAKLVALDEDIRAMPMQMYTQLSDCPRESLSGGQIQKILIARALATKPKVLLLDEATSALDNHSQQLIYKSLSVLKMTKIVIAHRYSTLADADCIYKLKNGLFEQLSTDDMPLLHSLRG